MHMPVYTYRYAIEFGIDSVNDLTSVWHQAIFEPILSYL